jgi:tetratricopeptide (TPR) repeat protein
MSNSKPKSPAPKTPPAVRVVSAKPAPAPAASAPATKPAAPPPTPRTPPLFRRIDWLTFLLAFAVVWVGYYLTLAPEMTLEDSGELATGSFYAGIPHPPGYPVWTIYTWVWTVLLPVGNIAWRVALAEATGGALAAGLLGLLVSRGSSLLMEGIEELKNMTGRWESAICMTSGFVAGALIGYNGFMWSQSVIVEVYSFSVASLMVVLLCLLRWIYAPHQRRWLYLALFVHGVCFTNHQTLIVAAIGIEVAIAAANLRIGRELWLGNTIVYLGGLVLSSEKILTSLESNPAIFVIYHVVGLASLLAYLWFTFLTRPTFLELARQFMWTAFWLTSLALPGLFGSVGGFFAILLLLGCTAGFVYLAAKTWKLSVDWLVVLICGMCWVAGASLYFYMPLAGMSNPPMEWGYPRTVEGFFHAFTRGQYDKTNPTDPIHHPEVFAMQLMNMGLGIVDEFNWVYMFLALVPFVFFLKMHRRERAWLIGITAIYLCLAVLLLILLNPPPDRAAQELNRVFFTASHTLIALLVGYALTLVAAFMATHYQRFRFWGLLGGGVAIALALLSFTEVTTNTYFGQDAKVSWSQLLSLVAKTFTNKDQYGLPVYAGLILIGMALAFVVALSLYRDRAPLAITLGLFALMPLHPILTHWSDNEERNHWFGYWFGHDMFTPPFKGADGKPLYPEMTKDAVLYGGTDPGRFAPTYMIFCDSFVPHRCLPKQDQNFDRRDVYIITQNALADATYLCYIRAQYNRSTQIDPPFFQELVRSDKEKQDNYSTNLVARAVEPLDTLFESLGDRIEKKRRTYTSWFREDHFTDLPALLGKLRPSPQQDPLSKYLYENLSSETQQLVTGNGDPTRLRQHLAEDLNRLMDRELQVKEALVEKKIEKQRLDQEIADANASDNKRQRVEQLAKEIVDLSKVGPLYQPDRFKQVQLSEYLQEFIKQNPLSHTRVRLNRLLLEAAYPKEIATSLGGIYPDREIYTATPEDSTRCFNDYMADASQRAERNQLDPGEDVRVDKQSGKVQISGQVAVMAINGLLTKVIFDHNPKNEFFVEESFPLKWMYPHLTPFGIIMKINRQPLPDLTEDILKRDHDFWSEYSERTIGKWITYDTSIKEITDFVEKTYLRRDFSGFKGDRAFVRDDQAQKAFSKLRSSIAGVYAWRLSPQCPEEYRPKTPAARQRLIKEAEFAFRQAFAYCPYSPEAVFRYVNLLLTPELSRFDDALLIASTCQKLDPYNGQVIDLVNKLKTWQKQREQASPALLQLEKAVHDNPDDFQAAFNLAGLCLQAGQNERGMEVLDNILNNPHAEANALRTLLQAFASINNTSKLQQVVDKLAAKYQANPTNFEAGVALAEGYHNQQKNDQAIQTLDQVLNDPKADATAVLQVAQQYAAMANYAKLEPTLEKLVKLTPEQPEAWYDLAALKANVGKTSEALAAAQKAFALSAQRLKQDPKAKDLAKAAQEDSRFANVRQNPEFKRMIGQ